VRFQREWFLLIGSLLVAGALYGHYMGHSVLLVELIMLGAGVGMALYAAKAISERKVEVADGIVFRLVAKVVSRKNVALVISVAGFILLFAWSTLKILVTKDTALHLEDFIVTLFGISLILYNTAPTKLHAVQDFSVFYLFFLTLVFVVIWKTYSLVSGESYGRITAYSEYYVVTAPTTGILNLLGFEVHASLNLSGPGLSNIIDYEHDGVLLKLGIGTGCSGLYSAGLFFSAFLAFILVRYQKVDAPAAAALGIGFAVTWLSNIIRMIFTIATGIAWGHPALAFVHAYIGILIFVAFITVFWMLIVRWLDGVYEKRDKSAGPSTTQETNEETVTP
jgi:exosortase/archaeosortase family protein